MNFEERYELFQKRRIEALCDPIIRRFFADFVAGKESDLERGIARCHCKMLLLALRDGMPLSEVLEMALADFKGQEEVLEDFIHDLGRRDIKRPAHDELDKAILMLWDGFDILVPHARNQEQAALFRTLPPLPRWNGRAAWQFVKTRTGMPGLTYETYRQRVRRLGLHQLEPILVQKIKIGKIGPSTFAPTISFTAAGSVWLNCVTRNGKKMSRDMETPARFNAANGSGGIQITCEHCSHTFEARFTRRGRITVDQAKTRRVRGGQRAPTNNSPDLHSIAGARSALSLDRIQPKRAR